MRVGMVVGLVWRRDPRVFSLTGSSPARFVSGLRMSCGTAVSTSVVKDNHLTDFVELQEIALQRLDHSLLFSPQAKN
jgi:hypothetical protein